MISIPNKETQQTIYLTIRLIEAKFENNVVRLGKMSPYAEIRHGEQIWKSQAAAGQHLSPHWNQSCTFISKSLFPLEIRFLHKSRIFSDVEIAKITINIDQSTRKKGASWWNLAEGSGRVLLCFIWDLAEEMRNSGVDYKKLIQEVELEKEEVKFYKKKTQQKLWNLKIESNSCKKHIKKATNTEESTHSDTEESNLKSPRTSFGRNSGKIDRIREEREKIKNEYKMMMEIRKKASREYEEIMKKKAVMRREMENKGMPRNSSEERISQKEEILSKYSEIKQVKMTLKMKETIIEEDTHTIMSMFEQIQKEREELDLKKSVANFENFKPIRV
ncbi:unnamed protein product [Blepharisma stoltei]|uniref:C2 domain-containing protein n=1 Tax=Blepharisma stoltei TaxID=1481888 RepID=A0AAU9J276_9CILI|nr:unnamed protein product [Blepharisma stoltei]